MSTSQPSAVVPWQPMCPTNPSALCQQVDSQRNPTNHTVHSDKYYLFCTRNVQYVSLTSNMLLVPSIFLNITMYNHPVDVVQTIVVHSRMNLCSAGTHPFDTYCFFIYLIVYMFIHFLHLKIYKKLFHFLYIF